MTSEHDTLLARVDRDAKFLDQCARDLKDNNGRAKQLQDMAATLRACKARILRYEQQRQRGQHHGQQRAGQRPARPARRAAPGVQAVHRAQGGEPEHEAGDQPPPGRQPVACGRATLGVGSRRHGAMRCNCGSTQARPRHSRPVAAV